MFAQAGDQFNEIAHSDSLYHGSQNANVFVGAFANRYASGLEDDFKSFMDKQAPYGNEKELKTWLSNQGFLITEAGKTGKYLEVYQILERVFADSLYRGKTPLLIEHDAIQLAQLARDIESGARTLFVTADRRLRDAATLTSVPNIAESMISHVGLVQFIEMMLGGVSTGTGMAQLLWSWRTSEKAESIRAYVTARALEHYDAGIAMSLSEIVDRYSATALDALERTNADPESDIPEKRIEAFRILGELDSNFFKGMNQAIDQKRRGH